MTSISWTWRPTVGSGSKVRSVLNAFLIAEIIELEWLSQLSGFDELNHGL